MAKIRLQQSSSQSASSLGRLELVILFRISCLPLPDLEPVLIQLELLNTLVGEINDLSLEMNASEQSRAEDRRTH